MSARKSGQTPLSRERITATALAIVDAEGLDALSMRRLGSELGVDASSIYYHVPNKSALYDLVIDAVMAGMDLSDIDEQATTHGRVMALVHAFRDTLLAHPHALPLLASRPLLTPESVRPAEYALAIFHEAGYDYAHGLAAINCIAYYVLGGTITYVNHLLDTEYHEDYDESRYLELPPEEFPHTIAAIQAGESREEFGRLEFFEEFETGADALVRGLLTTPPARSSRSKKR